MHRLLTAIGLPLAACVLLLPSLWGMQPTLAAPWHIYLSHTFGYSLSYPSDWQPYAAPGTNLAIESSDTAAVFDGVAQRATGTVRAADLRAVVKEVLIVAGASKTAKVAFATRMLHGVPFVTASTVVYRRSTGQVVQFTALVAYRAKVAYVFATALVTTVQGRPRPAAAAQKRMLATIVASITIMGPAQ